jgi:hypothetical protein
MKRSMIQRGIQKYSPNIEHWFFQSYGHES